MNTRLFFAMLPVLFLFVAASCGNSVSERLAETKVLLRTTDSVRVAFSGIDTLEVEKALTAAQEVKMQFRERVKNDTLELEFAAELESFLLAIDALESWNAESKEYFEAADAAIGRLTALARDMENGAGDRSQYGAYVVAERRTTSALNAHGRDLLERYRTSMEAFTQFQPAIERYLAR